MLNLQCRRLPIKEMAARLGVSDNTLNTHLKNLRRKLGASGREDTIVRAQVLGLVDDDDQIA